MFFSNSAYNMVFSQGQQLLAAVNVSTASILQETILIATMEQ